MAEEKKSRRSRREKPARSRRGKGKQAAPEASSPAPAAPPPAGHSPTAGEGPEAATGEEDGKLSFDPAIISEIAIREASDVEGLVELTGGWRSKGVQVAEAGDLDGEGYTVDLRIAVEYGVNCVALAETLRSRIARAVRRMTGRPIAAVNIHVTAIRDRGARGEQQEESEKIDEEHGIDF